LLQKLGENSFAAYYSVLILLTDKPVNRGKNLSSLAEVIKFANVLLFIHCHHLSNAALFILS